MQILYYYIIGHFQNKDQMTKKDNCNFDVF